MSRGQRVSTKRSTAAKAQLPEVKPIDAPGDFSTVAEFAGRWWAIALGIAAVIGAYFQLKGEVALIQQQHRNEMGALSEKVTRLEKWIKNKGEFPGTDTAPAVPSSEPWRVPYSVADESAPRANARRVSVGGATEIDNSSAEPEIDNSSGKPEGEYSGPKNLFLVSGLAWWSPKSDEPDFVDDLDIWPTGPSLTPAMKRALRVKKPPSSSSGTGRERPPGHDAPAPEGSALPAAGTPTSPSSH